MKIKPRDPAASLVHDPPVSAELLDTGAATLKLLAEPTRLHLLWLLSGAEYSVGDLVEATGISRTAVSQHLAKLRSGNLVQTRKEGRRVIYRMDDGHLVRLVTEAVNHADHVISGEPRHS
ncbi:metalloregulator ArsR/SmtB family transcription factor [Corynebacterium sp. P6129]|uniref:ArsR/SmtB family transcription factor n=1 Tax=Corynebacterium antarcticum TaxID=2800405 RepID=UPI002260B3D9|nr:metalloregulator ArsR/SmtB family transcription factor [Corynebacterium antarcticum]MCX7491558.1 metalloregulator ArsR/SmtB family transcription factor [Corynebacterium antarcticum]